MDLQRRICWPSLLLHLYLLHRPSLSLSTRGNRTIRDDNIPVVEAAVSKRTRSLNNAQRWSRGETTISKSCRPPLARSLARSPGSVYGFISVRHGYECVDSGNVNTRRDADEYRSAAITCRRTGRCALTVRVRRRRLRMTRRKEYVAPCCVASQRVHQSGVGYRAPLIIPARSHLRHRAEPRSQRRR